MSNEVSSPEVTVSAEAGASPDKPVADPAVAEAIDKANKLAEVTHSGFVGNWESEVVEPPKSAS